jgi:hypothetical protein
MLECVVKITKAEWETMAPNAHRAVFGQVLPDGSTRIDFALLAVDRSGTPMSYVTCQERDAESLYWQFGGSFPGTKGTVGSLQAMEAFLGWCRDHYKRVSFLVENSNKAMLKMALATGFSIIGTRNYKGSVLVEHLLELQGG